MSGPPFSPGFTQLTFRLSVVPGFAVTVGFAGLADFSSMSVRVIVTAMVSVPPVPSSAFTVTE